MTGAVVRHRTAITAALIAGAAALLYVPFLRDAPFYLNRDEMFSGLTAHSMASIGRDTTGRFLPLYFQTQMRYGSEMWFQPFLMYAITVSVKLMGLSEGAIRLPMALVGVADVVLVYFIARELFAREMSAIAAAVALALSPAHFINSRVAMDFQAPLPFMLGWLLCLLVYLRRPRSSLLFTAALLLGAGVYTYIAAYMLMPIYALLTCVVLYQRREPWRQSAIVVGGFMLPLLLCVPFLVAHPTVLHDIFWHYARDKPLQAGAADLFSGFFSLDRFAKAATVYAGFWSPRFLFINGPQSSWVAGAFLLPIAGVLFVGLSNVWRRSSSVAILLIGGLLTAPIPASLVGDAEAIHRAAEVLPFAVLIGIAGVDGLWSARHRWSGTIAFVTMWLVVVGLAALYHGELPRAQALIRAATVPIAVAVLAVVFQNDFHLRVRPLSIALASLVTLIAMELAYLAVGYTVVSWTAAAAAILMMFQLRQRRRAGPTFAPEVFAAALAAAASLFTFAYGNYAGLHRVGWIPATVIVLMVRIIYAACGVIVFLVTLRVASGADRGRVVGGAMVAVCAILVAQIAYLEVDYFQDYRLRLIQMLVVVAAIAAAAWTTGAVGAARCAFPQLAGVALLGLMAIQFGYFYADYFTGYRGRSGNAEPEGNGRVAWEAVLERAQHRRVPAVYFGSVGPYGFSDLYWTFYTIKHDRQDLLARTVSDVDFARARVRTLPDASVVVTSPSPERDALIDTMLASGELRDRTLLTAPDGTSKFWVLETGAQNAVAIR